MEYAQRKFLWNTELQTAVFIYGVLTSVFCGLMLISTLSTNLFMDMRYSGSYYYYETNPLYWCMVVGSTAHLISCILLAIGADKV